MPAFSKLPTWLLSCFMNKSENNAVPLLLHLSRLIRESQLQDCLRSCFFFFSSNRSRRTDSAFILLEQRTVSVGFTVRMQYSLQGTIRQQVQGATQNFCIFEEGLIPSGLWILEAGGETLNSLTGFTLGLSDVCRENVAALQPYFSSCGFTY